MKEKTKLLQFFGSLIEKIKDILKGLGCLVFILEFYHKWSKLGKIFFLDPTKNKRNLKKIVLGPIFESIKNRKRCLFNIKQKKC